MVFLIALCLALAGNLLVTEALSQRPNDVWSTNSLFPRESATRFKISLDGVWNFCLIGDNEIIYDDSMKAPTCSQAPLRIPVPSSYNDILPMKELRDHVGWVLYERQFYCPSVNETQMVLMRFDSVNYEARVWLDDTFIARHVGGHLPFTIAVDQCLSSSDSIEKVATNTPIRITVAVSNLLDQTTIPGATYEDINSAQHQPSSQTIPKGRKLVPDFDFFHYAGILRPVNLYVVPRIYIRDLDLFTEYKRLDDKTIDGLLHYNITIDNRWSDNVDGYAKLKLSVSSDNNLIVGIENSTIWRHNQLNYVVSGTLTMKNIKLWEPFDASMHSLDYRAQLYNILVEITGEWNGHEVRDSYEPSVGFRTIKRNANQLIINEQPVYLKGFGKHEEQSISGRSLSNSMLMHDIYLIKWTGANVIRTSHYPYSEEFFDETDAQGLLVIAESPAVGLHSFGNERLELHKKIVKEMIERDKNRASVVFWSLANEPRSDLSESDRYFGSLTSEVRTLMSDRVALYRQLTAAIAQDVSADKLAKYLDILMINRYFGWYEQTGSTELIRSSVKTDLLKWYEKHGKPIMMSEYGAEAIAGLHSLPAKMFSEEYQTELMIEFHAAFDDLCKSGDFFIGEMIWIFADFATPQSLTRVDGNNKGLFTRDRKPKKGAHTIRHRYNQMTCNRSTYGQI